jgi:hypothetical protein
VTDEEQMLRACQELMRQALAQLGRCAMLIAAYESQTLGVDPTWTPQDDSLRNLYECGIPLTCRPPQPQQGDRPNG